MANTAGHAEQEHTEASKRSSGPSCEELQQRGMVFERCATRAQQDGGCGFARLVANIVLQPHALAIELWGR
eukprot:CAMPEP_0171090790 /NCGR_PEP_ID=MMETSP0766_2-20121228/32066_1 /TAXON_ID=439317 /ORGANISM="Gambierdiscus australes, Strain CAWD 149" /LENGTH=70 /DNA_ID=CAMNT_0011548821 /DNA_START=148 /DNA_END=358 /DNA_ORIENTATION=+